MNSTVLPSFHFGMNHQGFAAARQKCPAYGSAMVGNVKIVLSEKWIVLLLHPHVDVPYSSWLLHIINLSLDGELCLRDGKNAAFV